MSQVVTIELELPDDLARIRLPPRSTLGSVNYLIDKTTEFV